MNDPAYKSALEYARDNDSLASTERLPLRGEEPVEHGYLLFMPLYLKGSPRDTLQSRRKNLEGFVIGLFSITEIVQRALNSINLQEIDVHIYDETASGEKRILYQSHYDNARERPPDDEESSILKKMHASELIDVGGRSWRILFYPTQKYFVLHENRQARGFLILGLVFTSIMVTYLLVTIGKTTYVENLINKRTSELESEISNHKLTENALQESESNFRNIFNNAQVGLFRSRKNDGKIITANTRFVQIFNYDNQKEVIYSFSLPNGFVNKEEYNNMLNELVGAGETKNFEAQLYKKDGATVWTRLWARLYPDKDYIEGVIIDITEEKEMAKEYQLLQSQLLQSQKLESFGRLAGGIAHDFNNLLTGIIGYSELLLNELPKDQNAWKRVKTIEEIGRRAGDLTRQLLAFSRKQILDIRVMNLNSVVRNMSKLLSRVIGEDIVLTLKIDNATSNINADLSQMEQVLMNLVINARYAMPKGGKLTIETQDVMFDEDYLQSHKGSKVGAYVSLSISDTGEGMTQDVKERIFEPFFTTKELGKGTGLGLSTVFGIVKQHNGYIWVDSDIGEGTTFNVYFPATQNAVRLAPKRSQMKMERGDEVILVVDDESYIRDFVYDTLAPLGYEVHTASNSDEAFKIFGELNERLDIILADIVLKGINGQELAGQIKKRQPDVKVVFMTGYSGEVIDKHGVLKSGIELIMKPLTPGILASKIREVLVDEKDITRRKPPNDA